MRPQSKKISWLGPSAEVPSGHWAPKTYHIRNWSSWSDAKKLKKLREISEEYGRDPEFRAWVIQNVCQGTENRDFAGQARRILSWVQNNVRYFNEPNELIQSPQYTIRKGFGDCDDSAVLMGAMLHSIAIPWNFVLAGKGRNGAPVRWSPREGTTKTWGKTFYHIYVEAGLGRPMQWVSMEPTIKGAPLGYDVVKDGISADKTGRAVLPELSGAFGDTQLVQQSTATALLSKLSLGFIAIGIVQSVISTLVLEWIMRRRKRR